MPPGRWGGRLVEDDVVQAEGEGELPDGLRPARGAALIVQYK